MGKRKWTSLVFWIHRMTSSVMTGETGLEPCAMCHSPHSGTGDYPLWNRDQGPQTYTMYNSPSYDMNDFTTGPQAPSSLCLVCHNGVFSSLVNYPGPGSHTNENYDYQMNPTFWAMLDLDLSNEHPISFTYDPAADNSQDNNGFPAAITKPNISMEKLDPRLSRCELSSLWCRHNSFPDHPV